MDLKQLIDKKFIEIVTNKTGFREAKVTIGPLWCNVQAISTAPETVHYELLMCNNKVYVCFHNEAHGNSYVWKHFAEEVRRQNCDGWLVYGRVEREVSDLDKLKEITEKLIDDVTPILKNTYPNAVEMQLCQVNTSLLPSTKNVAIEQGVPAEELLQEPLYIPDYQREYCWGTENVMGLINDILNFFSSRENPNEHYHLGTIILKQEDKRYAIIDGQQRLTTLAIWKYITNTDDIVPLLKNKTIRIYSPKAKNALRRARNSLEDFQKSTLTNEDGSNKNNGIDLRRIVFSVIILANEQPDDLAYTFFSNSNSTGKRLSDFDLLKTHHLRYIKHDGIAKTSVRRWHDLEKSNLMDLLLHQSLFRLRNWRSGIPFSFEASSNLDRRELYRHFSCSIDENPEFATLQMPQFQFDSILPGGQTFFEFTEHYRRHYLIFQEMDIVKKLDAALGWHSNGLIRDGIKAISFLFYCKFGAGYLTEAVYSLAYWLSQLRNAPRVMRMYINSSLFQETTSLLDRVTTTSQFLSSLLDMKKQYTIENHGKTAQYYWNALGTFLYDIEQKTDSLKNIHKSALYVGK